VIDYCGLNQNLIDDQDKNGNSHGNRELQRSDEYSGHLYHLDATEDLCHPYCPKELLNKVGLRNVLHCFAADQDDPTVHPRWGKVGKQKVEQAMGNRTGSSESVPIELRVFRARGRPLSVRGLPHTPLRRRGAHRHLDLFGVMQSDYSYQSSSSLQPYPRHRATFSHAASFSQAALVVRGVFRGSILCRIVARWRGMKPIRVDGSHSMWRCESHLIGRCNARLPSRHFAACHGTFISGQDAGCYLWPGR
jgi:hypothetical protein